MAMLLSVNPGSNVEAGLRRRRTAEGNFCSSGLAPLMGGQQAAANEIYEAITETFLKQDNLDLTQLAPHQLVPLETGMQYKDGSVIATGWEIHPGPPRLWRRRLVALPAALEEGLVGHEQRSDNTIGCGPAPGDHRRRPSSAGRSIPVTARQCGESNPQLQCHSNVTPMSLQCHSNVTSIAMWLLFLGMKDLIESFLGYRYIFRVDGSFQNIRSSIDAGNPVITHGYFTGSGHIVVVCGYNDKAAAAKCFITPMGCQLAPAPLRARLIRAAAGITPFSGCDSIGGFFLVGALQQTTKGGSDVPRCPPFAEVNDGIRIHRSNE